jgi:hypothetical protein
MSELCYFFAKMLSGNLPTNQKSYKTAANYQNKKSSIRNTNEKL